MINDRNQKRLCMQWLHIWFTSASALKNPKRTTERILDHGFAFVSADSYQYQLQSMWQKCWNTNQSLVHNLRFRERGPLKSWRPETMAEAIFSVLKEGLSLSQAARKYDIPYPTFVLYANRVHNMLGPSADGAAGITCSSSGPRGFTSDPHRHAKNRISERVICIFICRVSIMLISESASCVPNVFYVFF